VCISQEEEAEEEEEETLLLQLLLPYLCVEAVVLHKTSEACIAVGVGGAIHQFVALADITRSLCRLQKWGGPVLALGLEVIFGAVNALVVRHIGQSSLLSVVISGEHDGYGGDGGNGGGGVTFDRGVKKKVGRGDRSICWEMTRKLTR
jgi:hypothetical protein